MLDVVLVEERLFTERESIAPKYLGDLIVAGTPKAFSDQLIKAMEQPTAKDPLTESKSASEVFEAAVRSLGSNQTNWASYMKAEDELRDLLHGFDPIAVASDLAAEPARISTDVLEQVVRGQYRRPTSRRILRWAKMLEEEPDWYRSVQRLGALIKDDADLKDDRELMPVLALALSGYLTVRKQRSLEEVGAKRREPGGWKLNGMGFALASEFLRNLGWDGFKPDTHVQRLFNGWLSEAELDQFAQRSEQLADLVGTRSGTARTILRYSLAGLAITPEGERANKIDNLVWLLGANIERKHAESEMEYLRPS